MSFEEDAGAKSNKIQHRWHLGSASGRGAQVRILGKALPTSVQGRPAVSRRRLVIAGTFEVPRSAWARR
jgi:hypothetical protein